MSFFEITKSFHADLKCCIKVHNNDLPEDVESSVTSQNLKSNDTYLDFHVFLVDKLKYSTH